MKIRTLKIILLFCIPFLFWQCVSVSLPRPRVALTPTPPASAAESLENIRVAVFKDKTILFIQTAGSIPKFTLHNVPSPHALRQQILDLSAEDKKHHSA